MSQDVHNGAKRFLWCIAMLGSGFVAAISLLSMFFGNFPTDSDSIQVAVSIPVTLTMLAYSFSRWADTYPQPSTNEGSEKTE